MSRHLLSLNSVSLAFGGPAVLDDVSLSRESFRSFLDHKPFERLNQRIAAVNQAEIFPVSLMPYLPILEEFGMETLGDVQRMVEESGEDAYQLALAQLAVTDLDILSESVGLQNLCFVHTLRHGGGSDAVRAAYQTARGRHRSHRPR